MAIHQSPSIYWGFKDIRIFCLIVFYTCDGLAFCLPLRYFTTLNINFCCGIYSAAMRCAWQHRRVTLRSLPTLGCRPCSNRLLIWLP